MIQSQGVALKSRVPVSLGRVSCVPGIGGEAEIGEAVMLHDQTQLVKSGQITFYPAMGMQVKYNQNQGRGGNKQKERVSFSHSIGPSLKEIPFSQP